MNGNIQLVVDSLRNGTNHPKIVKEPYLAKLTEFEIHEIVESDLVNYDFSDYKPIVDFEQSDNSIVVFEPSKTIFVSEKNKELDNQSFRAKIVKDSFLPISLIADTVQYTQFEFDSDLSNTHDLIEQKNGDKITYYLYKYCNLKSELFQSVSLPLHIGKMGNDILFDFFSSSDTRIQYDKYIENLKINGITKPLIFGVSGDLKLRLFRESKSVDSYMDFLFACMVGLPSIPACLVITNDTPALVEYETKTVDYEKISNYLLPEILL